MTCGHGITKCHSAQRYFIMTVVNKQCVVANVLQTYTCKTYLISGLCIHFNARNTFHSRNTTVNHNAANSCFIQLASDTLMTVTPGSTFNTSRVFPLPAALPAAITVINSLLPLVLLCRYRAPRLAITLVGLCSHTMPVSYVVHMWSFISCKLYLSSTSFSAVKYHPTHTLFICLCLILAVPSRLLQVNLPCRSLELLLSLFLKKITVTGMGHCITIVYIVQ